MLQGEGEVKSLANPRYRDTLAKELSIDRKWITQCISFKKSLLYLIHFEENDKYHYPTDSCKGTLKLELMKLIQSTVFDEEKSNEILDIILTHPNITTVTLLREVNKRGLYSTYSRAYTLYKDGNNYYRLNGD